MLATPRSSNCAAMELSACPVCTLYLREGMSLYDHLETHPKEHVIEALVRLHEDVQLSSIPTTQALTSPLYHSSPQVLPMQQYSSNAFSYQPMLTSGMNQSNSPVTMLVPQNTSGGMVYNPFIMQQSLTPQMHVVNSSNSDLLQQTSIQRTICATSSLNIDSRNFIHSTNAMPVLTTPSSESTDKSQSQSTPNNQNKSVITTLSHPDVEKSVACSRSSLLIPAGQVIDSFSPVMTLTPQNVTKAPVVSLQPSSGSGKSSAKQHRNVRIVHILPKPQMSGQSIGSGHGSQVKGTAMSPKATKTEVLYASTEKSVTHMANDNIHNLNENIPSNTCAGNAATYNKLLPARGLSSEELHDEGSSSSHNTSSESKRKLPTMLVSPVALTAISDCSTSPNFYVRPHSTPSISFCIDPETSEDVSNRTTTYLIPKSENVDDCVSFGNKLPRSTVDSHVDDKIHYSLHSVIPERVVTVASSILSTSPISYSKNLHILSTPGKTCSSTSTTDNKMRNKSTCTDLEVSSVDLTELSEREYFDQPSSSHFQTGNCSQDMHYSDDSRDILVASPSYRTSPRLPVELVSRESPSVNHSEDFCGEEREVQCRSAPSPASSETSNSGLRIRTDLGSKLPEDSQESKMFNKSEEYASNFMECSNDGSDVVAVDRESGMKIQLIAPLKSDEYITSDCFVSMNHEDASVECHADIKVCESNYAQGSVDKEDVAEETVPKEYYIFPDDSAASQKTASAIEVTISQCSKLTTNEQVDDVHVSTSYDLLARESWITSDNSDTEVNADCHVPSTWEDVVQTPPERRYTKGRTLRVYKCAVCGETFNCPKERRVHRSNHHANKDKIIPSELQPMAADVIVEQAIIEPPLRKQKKKIIVKKPKTKVLLVKDESSTDFLGVFVQEDEARHADDDGPPRVEEVSPVDDLKVCRKQEVNASVGADVKPDFREEKIEENSRWKCLTCAQVFIARRVLIAHLRSTHRTTPVEGNFMCDVCQDIFMTETVYNAHLKFHPLECKICGKNFYRRQNLILHTKRHLGIKPYKCSVCAKSFVTKQKLDEHKNVHTGAAPIKCPLCPMSFKRYSNLIQHKNRLHYKLKKKVKDYVCHCGEIFHSRKKLYWHKEVHDGKPKHCTFCSERFIHSASLTRHIRRAHDHRYMPKVGREGENKECSICGHMFLRSSIVTHMRLHTGERPFSCAVCGKNFTTKWNLQMHRWTHMSRSNKPFKCTLCKSAFSRESDYTQHMDAHRNKRQYTCNVCGEQFVRKNNCQRHVREHDATKMFTCKECGKQFHRGYYLKDHMRVHTGARPYVCHICNKSSSTKSNHNKHVKIHHAREPVNTES